MGTTTFTGPIKAGTIRDTTGTTVGSDIANVGSVVMSQTFDLDISAGAVTARVTDVVIPANSQIVDIVVDMITAANSNTNLSVGKVGGTGSDFLNGLPSGTTDGLKTITTQGGGSLGWEDVGTSDVRLTVTSGSATTAGLVRFTILYVQNNNLA
jgi:hypothetical protein